MQISALARSLQLRAISLRACGSSGVAASWQLAAGCTASWQLATTKRKAGDPHGSPAFHGGRGGFGSRANDATEQQPEAEADEQRLHRIPAHQGRHFLAEVFGIVPGRVVRALGPVLDLLAVFADAFAGGVGKLPGSVHGRL